MKRLINLEGIFCSLMGEFNGAAFYGDLEERRQNLLGTTTALRVNLWFLRQIATSLMPLVVSAARRPVLGFWKSDDSIFVASSDDLAYYEKVEALDKLYVELVKEDGGEILIDLFPRTDLMIRPFPKGPRPTDKGKASRRHK
jgi:hypothetical protein